MRYGIVVDEFEMRLGFSRFQFISFLFVSLIQSPRRYRADGYNSDDCR